MISVVIPSYNRRILTERAVRSVLQQTYSGEMEILVVDDHSRPEEVYPCGPGEEGRVRVLSTEGKGVSLARNTGVQAARGELIAFLDSDDYWLPRRLEDSVALFRTLPDPDNTLVYAAYYSDDGVSSTVSAPFAIGPKQGMGDYLFLDYGCLHVNTWLGTKKLFARFPFDPRLSAPEDWDVLLRMGHAGVRFVHLPRPAAVRHVDPVPDRLTTVPNLEMQFRFLEFNAERMGPRARLVYESILREIQQPPKSPGGKLAFKAKFIASSPLLGPGGKLALLIRYVASRVRHKLQQRRSRRKVREGDPLQVPAPEGISERRK